MPLSPPCSLARAGFDKRPARRFDKRQCNASCMALSMGPRVWNTKDGEPLSQERTPPKGVRTPSAGNRWQITAALWGAVSPVSPPPSFCGARLFVFFLFLSLPSQSPLEGQLFPPPPSAPVRAANIDGIRGRVASHPGGAQSLSNASWRKSMKNLPAGAYRCCCCGLIPLLALLLLAPGTRPEISLPTV